MTPPRLIRLRRPPTIVLQDEGPFVPSGGVGLNEIERRWRVFCKKRPGSFDGRICHVLGVHRNGHGGAVIHCMDCAYRFYAVQDVHLDLGVRPLGVKGIVTRGGKVLLGLRSAAVTVYPLLWEFAPGGAVQPGESAEAAMARELTEETGLRLARGPTSLALLFDPEAHTWEVIYRIEASGRAVPAPAEYKALAWRCPDELQRARELSPLARQMTGIVLESCGPDFGNSKGE